MKKTTKIITIISGAIVFVFILIGCLPTRYDCTADIYDCSDFESQNEAQQVFEYCLENTGFDIHKLDRNINGKACDQFFE